MRTYKYIKPANGHHLPLHMATIQQRRRNNGAILMNFNEFKAEYLSQNRGLDPDAQRISPNDKKRRRDLINQAWAKTIGINKRDIVFNRIYDLPTNHVVKTERQNQMAQQRRAVHNEYFPSNEQHAFVARSFSHGDTPHRQQQRALPVHRQQQGGPQVRGHYQVEPPRGPPEDDQ